MANQDGELGGLIRGIAQGNREAMDRFYDVTCSRVYGIALKILTEPQLAEEATLDVYTKIWDQAGSFVADKGTVPVWLNTIARNASLHLLRKEKRSNRPESLEESHWDPAVTASQEQDLTRSELSRVIFNYMASLTRDQQQVLHAAYFQGLSHSEIAEALGQPLGSVKTRIRSALRKLRQLLRGYEGELR